MDVEYGNECDGDEFASRGGKWAFLSSSSYDDDDDDNNDEERGDGRSRKGRRHGTIRNILVCGDGDLSHCASMSRELYDDHGCDDDDEYTTPPSRRPRLIATVLEDMDDHVGTYRDSRSNADIIASYGQYVMYGIDATMLSTYDFGAGGSGGGNRDEDKDDDNDDNDDSMISSSSSSSSSMQSSSMTSFDRVQFNFPHWKGKSNNRYNR